MKKQILVVEDDPHIRLGRCDALTAENYEVTECASGSAASCQLRQTRADLVILDIMLPGKGGYDLCREIRTAKSRVPILMRGHAVAREAILNAVWGIDYYGTTRTLDQLIIKLRQKLEDKPGEPEHLVTVHTLGYRLET